MGKNRSRNRQPSGSNGESPTIGDMEIPNGVDTITVQPEENPGTRTTLERNEEKIRKELNQLYSDVYDAEEERSFLHRDMLDRQREVQNIQDKLDAVKASPNATEIRITDLQRQLDKANREYGQATTLYEKQRDKVQEMNNRIFELETGFSGTAPYVNWAKGEIGNDDDGL